MLEHSGKQLLLREDKDGICTLTLNRPETRNALSSELLSELQKTFNIIASDKKIKVIIIAGNGSMFSSGHDLKEIRKNSSYNKMLTLFNQCGKMMITMKPTDFLVCIIKVTRHEHEPNHTSSSR